MRPRNLTFKRSKPLWRNCNPRARIWKVSKPLLTESRGWKKSPSSWKWLQAEQGKHDAIVAETEQLVVNNAALRQLKADQDARLSPPNLKTRASQVIHDFNVVVIDGGAADLGVVPGSKLAVMGTATKLPSLT